MPVGFSESHRISLLGKTRNNKRTYRSYIPEGRQVRTKQGKKLQRSRQPMIVAVAPNQRWSVGFVSDQLSNGRRFRVLNLIDDYSREVIDQLVSFRYQVGKLLDSWIKQLSLALSPQPLSVTTAPSLGAKQCSFGARLRG